MYSKNNVFYGTSCCKDDGDGAGRIGRKYFEITD